MPRKIHSGKIVSIKRSQKRQGNFLVMTLYKPTHEFEVWPDPREDDGVAEGEDEHGDVDDVE